jgi:hypothetical protein
MTRWGVKLCGTVAVLACLAMVPASAGAAPLTPDLTTLKAAVRLCQETPNPLLKKNACKGRGSTVLRIVSKIANAGRGPLEYAPVAPTEDIPADCHGDGNPDMDGDGDPDDNDVLTEQRIYNDVDGNGIFQRSTDTSWTTSPVACRYYHPEHDHYHVEAFSRFMLRRDTTNQIVAASQKISFCVADTDPFDLSLPGALQPIAGDGFYRVSGCNGRLSTQGISVGWYDLYGYALSGQQIDITGIPAGNYCLIQRADPDDLLEETNELNNDLLLRFNINPALAPVNAQRTLVPIRGGCLPV